MNDEKIFGKNVISLVNSFKSSKELNKEDFDEIKDGMMECITLETGRYAFKFMLRGLFLSLAWVIISIINISSCIRIWKNASDLILFLGVPMILILILMTVFVLAVLYCIRQSYKYGCFTSYSINRIRKAKKKLNLLINEEYDETKSNILEYKYIALIGADIYVENKQWIRLLNSKELLDDCKNANKKEKNK